MLYKTILIIFLSLLSQTLFANNVFYYLCGSDEDGCVPGYEQFCACIAESAQYDQPYCLNLTTMQCAPLKMKSHCDVRLNNQAECLAALFQSEPRPPCPRVTDTFCHSHPVYFCDESGAFNTCKKSYNQLP